MYPNEKKDATLHNLAEGQWSKQAALGLHSIFRKLVAQQNMRGVVFHKMTEEQKLSYANECVLALSVEVSELASSWPFASWKTTETDTPNIEREIVDCLFFLVNISSCFGIKPEDIISRLEVVLENNQRRIDAGIHKNVKL